MGYKCKLCGKEYKSNISGSCVKHLKTHSIESKEIDEYFDEVDIVKEEGIHCPICGKKYKNNLGGAVTSHLVKEHSYSKEDVKKDFPFLFVGKKEYDYGSETRICVICNKPFEHKKYVHKDSKKTCSTICAGKLISRNKTTSVESTCQYCNTTFKHKKSKDAKYCSVICKANAQKGRQEYKIKLDVDEIKRLYLEENLSCEVIGKRYSVGKKLIRSRLIDMEVELRVGFYSSVEDELIAWLKSIGINDIVKGDRKILDGKELDIYLPEYNLAIEYNGLYWHSESIGKDRKYHLNKTEMCEKLGIQLIHIFEDEWINKENIVKNIISTKLGMGKKVYARKCVVEELKSKDTKQFLDDNHIQGYIPAKVNLGLYYEDELVSLLTFRKSRFNGKYEWEIARFVNKSGVSITGGFSKLLKYFRKNNSGSIVTYSDRRYFDGRVYESSGFERQKPSSPNYFYTKYLDRKSRQQFQKHKLKDKLEVFDPELTEWENMQLNGWDRIWDCGNNIYEYMR